MKQKPVSSGQLEVSLFKAYNEKGLSSWVAGLTETKVSLQRRLFTSAAPCHCPSVPIRGYFREDPDSQSHFLFNST